MSRLNTPKPRASVTNQRLVSFELNMEGNALSYNIHDIVGGETVKVVNEHISLFERRTGVPTPDINAMRAQLNSVIRKILADARSKGLLEEGVDTEDLIGE